MEEERGELVFFHHSRSTIDLEKCAIVWRIHPVSTAQDSSSMKPQEGIAFSCNDNKDRKQLGL